MLLPLPSWWAWVRFAKKLYIWLEAWLALHVKLEGLLPKTSVTQTKQYFLPIISFKNETQKQILIQKYLPMAIILRGMWKAPGGQKLGEP